MRHIIPIQNIDQIEISLITFNKLTQYSKFSIKFKGVVDTEIKLTGDTILLITDAVKKMIKERNS